MSGVLVVAGVLVALAIGDRVLLWMESRGWIFYRRTKRRGGGALTSAFWVEWHSAFNPSVHEAVEIAVEEKKDQDNSGDPPTHDPDDPPAEEDSGNPPSDGPRADGPAAADPGAGEDDDAAQR